MKLQHKIAVYNTVTKIAVIAILGALLLVFIDRISINHLKQRLVDKRNKLVKNLSVNEIEELLNQQSTFTDYNILKEEYIILTEETNSIIPQSGEPIFTQETREIEGEQEDYLVIKDYFQYAGIVYKLEIGETMLLLHRLQKTILYFTLLTLFVAVGLMLVVDLAFTRYLLTPFYRIVEQKLNKVNDPVHYNYLPEKTTTDDFVLLDESISTLMKKISEQLLIEKQFISNVSHELLTPITILRTRLENMLSDRSISEDSINKISASLKTLNRLKSIINSLLLISKVENKQFNREEKIDIVLLLHDIFEEMQERLEFRNITYQTKLTNNFRFTGNYALLHTLFINLINNAIKYNHVNGTIILTDKMRENTYLLTITDSGIGMDEVEIEKAFTRFEKLGNNADDSHGLGLAIVKTIAIFHDISIAVKSTKKDGTSVILSFKTADNLSS